MSILNWILFVWLSMALIKLIIMLGTVIDGIAKFGNPESNIIMLIRSFLLGALVSVAITITVWPILLISEGLEYFKFPNKDLQEIIKDHFTNKY